MSGKWSADRQAVPWGWGWGQCLPRLNRPLHHLGPIPIGIAFYSLPALSSAPHGDMSQNYSQQPTDKISPFETMGDQPSTGGLLTIQNQPPVAHKALVLGFFEAEIACCPGAGWRRCVRAKAVTYFCTLEACVVTVWWLAVTVQGRCGKAESGEKYCKHRNISKLFLGEPAICASAGFCSC